MRRNQIVVHVARMAGRVAQPLDAADSRNMFEQMRQRPRASIRSLAMIGVDVLAEQRDFANAGVGEPLHLGHDLGPGREISAPRVYGTTQNVQNLSQPSCTVTKAVTPRARIAAVLGAAR